MTIDRKPSAAVLRQWAEHEDPLIASAAMYACRNRKFALELIEKGLDDYSRSDRCAAEHGDDDDYYILSSDAGRKDMLVRDAAADACRGLKLPMELVGRWSEDHRTPFRIAAMNACLGRKVPIELIKRGLEDEEYEVREAAMNACLGRKVPIELVKQGLEDEEYEVRMAAMNACRGRWPDPETIERWARGLGSDPVNQYIEMFTDIRRAIAVPLETVTAWLDSEEDILRTMAMDACNNLKVPFGLIERGLADPSGLVREAAAHACLYQEIPIGTIKRWMTAAQDAPDLPAGALDPWLAANRDVPCKAPRPWMKAKSRKPDLLAAAMCACKGQGIPVPLVRVTEPPELIRQSWIGDPVIELSIPDDAQIRADDSGYRTDKAVIRKITGDICGEPCAIRRYNLDKLYYEGDKIESGDFDLHLHPYTVNVFDFGFSSED